MGSYKITVVIIAGDAEKTISRCINSIIIQTYDLSKTQILIVNNNSNGMIAEICQNYLYSYPNIEYYPEKSFAELFQGNTEIIQGEYIIFLDADCFLGKNTVESIMSFWSGAKDEVDLVFFNEEMRLNTKEQTAPGCLSKTGIYDTFEKNFILPRRASYCIKKCAVANYSVFTHNDMSNMLDLLAEKEKFGYLKEAKYYSRSIKQVTDFYDKTADEFVLYFEQKFAYYTQREMELPYYVQAGFLQGCTLRFREGVLWPFYDDIEKLCEIKTRIIHLLQYISDTVILSVPELDSYEKVFWIRLKDEREISYTADCEKVCLYAGDTVIHERKGVEIVLVKVLIQSGMIKVRGYLKCPLFDFCDTKMYIDINGERQDICLVDSGVGYYKAREKTSTFWGFEFVTEHSTFTQIKFNVFIDGKCVNTMFYNQPTSIFGGNAKYCIIGNVLAEQYISSLVFKTIPKEKLAIWQNKDLENEKNQLIRKCKKSVYGRNMEEIWIYADAANVKYGNAYLQFKHDKDKDDGIRRVYLVNRKWEKEVCFEGIESQQLVFQDSMECIELLISAKRILTSDINASYLSGNGKIGKRELQYRIHAEIIYLQHSVVLAHMPWVYSKYKNNIDKVVVSTEIEKNNFCRIYDYDETDILCTGMARLDSLRTDSVKTGKLLFAPLWRRYIPLKNECFESSNMQKRMEFDYIKENMCFLTGERLCSYLKENSLVLEYIVHPAMKRMCDFENVNCECIREVQGELDLNEYDYLITDYSSFIFDFRYMGKSVCSIIPDKKEVLGGLNGFAAFNIKVEDVSDYCFDNYEAFLNCTSQDYTQTTETTVTFFEQSNCNREKLYNCLTGKRQGDL